MKKQRESELTLFQNFLHGLAQGHLTITAGETFSGEITQPRCIMALYSLTFNLSLSKHPTSSMHSHLKKLGVRCRSVAPVVGDTAVGAPWVLPLWTFPQMLEVHPLKTASDLEVIGEQKKLPALFQFSLDLQTNTSLSLTITSKVPLKYSLVFHRANLKDHTKCLFQQTIDISSVAVWVQNQSTERHFVTTDHKFCMIISANRCPESVINCNVNSCVFVNANICKSCWKWELHFKQDL